MPCLVGGEYHKAVKYSLLKYYIKPMLFSSPIFLYFFLPLTLLFTYISPKSIRNYILLLASLLFYAWGGIGFVALLIFSFTITFFFGLAINAAQAAYPQDSRSRDGYHMQPGGSGLF